MQPPSLSHTAAILLQALAAGHRYGLSIMEATGLPSGTVYPALRRLERDHLVSAHWESEKAAEKEGRPARKYYRPTATGEKALEAARKRYPHLAALFLGPKVAK
ncbi:MAG: PadR family transcriptional regulator [Bryobacteraceae bacterium]|nr:PadR family transcriptional regulator [Bryobacteraceae bacterium]